MRNSLICFRKISRIACTFIELIIRLYIQIQTVKQMEDLKMTRYIKTKEQPYSQLHDEIVVDAMQSVLVERFRTAYNRHWELEKKVKALNTKLKGLASFSKGWYAIFNRDLTPLLRKQIDVDKEACKIAETIENIGILFENGERLSAKELMQAFNQPDMLFLK